MLSLPRRRWSTLFRRRSDASARICRLRSIFGVSRSGSGREMSFGVIELDGMGLTSSNTSDDVAFEELAMPFGRADVVA